MGDEEEGTLLGCQTTVGNHVLQESARSQWHAMEYVLVKLHRRLCEQGAETGRVPDWNTLRLETETNPETGFVMRVSVDIPRDLPEPLATNRQDMERLISGLLEMPQRSDPEGPPF